MLGTQSLVHARQTLYQASHPLSPCVYVWDDEEWINSIGRKMNAGNSGLLSSNYDLRMCDT